MSFIDRIGLIDLDRFTGRNFVRRGLPIMGIAILVVALVAVRLMALGSRTDDVISAKAEYRSFVASVIEKGTLSASRTETYAAPRLRRGGSQQILEMAPEGTLVKPGDLIVQFDDAALREQIRQQKNDVERSEAELRKNRANQDSQMAGLLASLELAKHTFSQAELNQAKLEFAAEVEKRREEINFEKSKIALQKAEEAITSQERQNDSQLQRFIFRLNRDKQELADMEAELEQSKLYARSPGLVSYEMTWGQSGRTKVKVGDSPFPGQSIISLPDLTTMIMEIQVSELDYRRVAVGQRALVRVDAYPDTVYTAQVTDVSPLARRVGSSQLKVFDCTVRIEGTDLRLRPGMSSTIMVISEYEEKALVIPMDAVFRKEGRTIVYTLNGGIHEVEVEVGADNGNFVVVQAGLSEGDLVALRDPYVPLRKIQSAGADALRQQREGGSGSGGSGVEVFRGMERIMMFDRGGGGGGGSSGGSGRGRGGRDF